MESKQKPLHPSDYDSDKDVSFLLYKTAQAIKRALNGLGSVLVAIGLVIKNFFLFLFRNLAWLVLGTVIGLGFGLYKYMKAGPQYSSELVVQVNFNSARSLYNTIEHINILIGNGGKDELSRIFKITKDDAAKLTRFTIEPVKEEMIVADMYRRKFLLDPVDKHNIRQDTFWTRTVPYRDFKESLKEYDYPLHKITAISYNRDLFGKLQNGITDRLLANELAGRFKTAEAENNEEDIKLLAAAIDGLDTLRRTYNEKLRKGDDIPQVIDQKAGLPQNNFSFVAPELELYDRLMQLREELKLARRRAVQESNVVEVHSEFVSPGKRVPLLEENILQSTIMGLIFVLAILFLIQVVKLFLAVKATR